MKFKPSNVIWGLSFIVIGILLYCKAFMGWDVSLWNIFWRFWPLFIILPSISGMLTKGFNLSSLIWLLAGTAFLLMTNDLVSGSLIRKLVVPVALVVIGIGIMFKDVFSKGNSKKDTKDNYNYKYEYNYSYNKNGTYSDNTSYTEDTSDSAESNSNSSNNNGNGSSFFSSDSTSQKKPEYNAIFSSTQVKYPNEIFMGTCINSVFGSVVLDLRDAIITEDVVINATVVFAGADIYVPGNVNIKVSSVPIFGGVSNKVGGGTPSGPTIFVNATCMFGGLDIK